MSGLRYCATPNVRPGGRHVAGVSERAALLNEAFWSTGASITVSFTEGEAALHRRVADIADEWPRKTKASFEFIFLDQDEDPASANIRIGFRPDLGSWSVLGRYALDVPPEKTTMNLGWMTLDLVEEEARAVVLHEFGHALGLIHEHMNPHGHIAWNICRVREDLKRTQGWDDATIQVNMFDLYDPKAVYASDIDPASIMMYPIPPEWTTDGYTVGFNSDLSQVDIDLIRSAYGVRTDFGGGG